MVERSILPLEVRGLAVRFGPRPVLRDVGFRIAAGEAVALLGPNGSGKTTLFGAVCGLVVPDRGGLRFAGQPRTVPGLAERAQLGYLAHAPQLTASASAAANIELVLELRQIGRLERQRRARQALERVGLDPGDPSPVGTYSRGMAQRAALARVLACRASLLVLDEPFTALDVEGRRQALALLGEERRRGAAVLFSSHDLESVEQLADRVLELRAGTVWERAGLARR